jgi:hypothetical protein
MFSKLAFNWKAQTAHGLHSPFVFDLYTQVINPIYQQNPANLTEALIHGIGKYLKLPVGKLHVIDFTKVQAVDINIIEDLMQDKEAVLICLNIRKTNETLQNWEFVATNQQAIHSIELYEMGIISLKPIAPKQHFYLKRS